jgi:hypothetical protein
MRHSFHTHQALLHRTLALAALVALLAAATSIAAERALSCLVLRGHTETSFVVSGPAQNATPAKALTIPARPIRLGR